MALTHCEPVSFPTTPRFVPFCKTTFPYPSSKLSLNEQRVLKQDFWTPINQSFFFSLFALSKALEYKMLLVNVILYLALLISSVIVVGGLGLAMRDATYKNESYCPLSMRFADHKLDPGDGSVCSFTLFAAIGGSIYALLFCLWTLFKLCKGIAKFVY